MVSVQLAPRTPLGGRTATFPVAVFKAGSTTVSSRARRAALGYDRPTSSWPCRSGGVPGERRDDDQAAGPARVHPRRAPRDRPVPSLGGRARLARRRPPLASRPATRKGHTVYGFGSVDGRGRVSDLLAPRAMGWTPGTRVELRVVSGLVVVRARADAVARLTGQGYPRLPAPVRCWCGLVAGDRVLLVAEPAQPGPCCIRRRRWTGSWLTGTQRCVRRPPPHAMAPPHATTQCATTRVSGRAVSAENCSSPSARAADLDAARVLLARLGVSPAELLSPSPPRPPVPTFGEYIPVVAAAVRRSPGVAEPVRSAHRWSARSARPDRSRAWRTQFPNVPS